LLALSSHAPSVGLSQPWRFVLVETPERRLSIRSNFERANQAALEGYKGERQVTCLPVVGPRIAGKFQFSGAAIRRPLNGEG